jgi:formylglycine-generating enzyme required for sulfatase activity
MSEENLLGDYRIIKQMGMGPTGAVYLAEHRFIKKQYVLKVLPKELSCDRSFLQKFEEEVVKLAAIEHPHLVKVHNISYSDGVYFLVTDCIVDSIGETTNLAQYMAGRKEKLREDELLSVTRQVAGAIDFLHEKGICHLGLKLNNILIGKGKPGIDIFLSETALNKILNPAAIVSRTFKCICEALETFPVQVSKTGEELYQSHPIEGEKLSKLTQSFLQSYAFLAPEQKKMTLPTAAADAYAFGVLVYYLITGQFPEGLFIPIKEQAPLYQYDWDAVINPCLAFDIDRRPLKLLPLLGKRLAESSATTSIPHVPVMPHSLEPALRAFQDETKEPSAPAAVLMKTVEAPITPTLVPTNEQSLSAEPVCQQPTPTLATTPYLSSDAQESFEHQVENFCLSAHEPVALNATTSHLAQPVSRSLSMPVMEPVKVQPAIRLAPVIQRHAMTPPTEPVVNAPPLKMELAEKRDFSEATSPVLTPSHINTQFSPIFEREPVVKAYSPQPISAEKTEPLYTEMVIIPGGRYMRGCNEGNRDEAPYHMIDIKSFALDIHPVTNEQFVRFLEFMGGEKDQNYNDIIRFKDSRINRTAGKLHIESGYAKHPVVGVTWYGAVAYAAWVGKRLPTEGEWEVAARGGYENCLYPTGKTIEKNQANFFSSDTTAVMSYAANPYGIYDLAGNIYEWCQDWYSYNYYETTAQEPNNPKGPLQGVYRVLRGGCWKSLKEDLRCSHRHRNNPGAFNGTYGFRCAADVQEI